MKVREGNFMIHIDESKGWVNYDVYPIIDVTNFKTKETAIKYIGLDGDCELMDFIHDKCIKKMTGILCWRGVWDSRLWFTDDEYWGEDLGELSVLYYSDILPLCKDIIQSKYPSIDYAE